MPVKFDHMVTMIIESHDTDTLSVAELQGSIESHVNKILKNTEKVVKEEALKTQVNFNNTYESSRTVEERGQNNSNNKGRGNYRGRGRGNFGGRGRGNFNQWRDNNFNGFIPTHLGRGGHSFGSTYHGRRRDNYNT
ncbi:unnamed protein product [Vicia faba]|uniref:Uncharacterized protein n=1 Tax=Vicia faba TaxID=3906 RepID=A0AAV0Z3V3_VICFA|nr:unnamed protein product [Vicia faba]